MWLDNPRNPNSPLAGLKVLDLSRVLAGPWAGQILADLGADVIKVESPEGDTTRTWAPPILTRPDGTMEAAYYHTCNRGKRGVIADFNAPDDLRKISNLARTADVLIENFKPGTLAKFHLDYASISPANPALVYCSITGFGQNGPRRDEPGYDFVAQGMSGLMSLTGEPEGAPMKMGVSISDLACGTWSANAIQSALLMRHRTGRGQHIDMALLDCSVALLANQAMSYFATGDQPDRMGNAHAQVSPYGVYPTSDGHIILAPANDRLFQRLLDALGMDELARDPRFADNAGRIEHRRPLEAAIEEKTRKLTRAELLEICRVRGVPAAPINSLDDVFADPQIIAREMLVELDGVQGIRTPFNFSDAELALDAPSPKLGEHQNKL